MKKFSLGRKPTYTQIRLNILNKLSCSKVYCHYTTSNYDFFRKQDMNQKILFEV